MGSVERDEFQPIGADMFAERFELFIGFDAVTAHKKLVPGTNLDAQLSRIDKAGNLSIIELLSGAKPCPVNPWMLISGVKEGTGDCGLDSGIGCCRKKGIESAVG